MSQEIAATRNWPHPPTSPAIAPVGKPNAAKRVRLDGTSSAAASGLPQCAIASYAWKTDNGATGTGPTLSHFFRSRQAQSHADGRQRLRRGEKRRDDFQRRKRPKARQGEAEPQGGHGEARADNVGAGKLTLSGKGVKKQAKQIKKAGKASVTLKPTGKT